MDYYNKGRGRPFISSTSSTRVARGGRSHRGGYQGGRGGFSKPQNVPDTSLHPLGDLLTTLTNDYLGVAAGSMTESPTITGCEYVASYSWLNTKSPTIVVPGRPPLWTPLRTPKRLKEDDSEYYRDPNAARFPSYPMEPVVEAIFQTAPDFQTADINIVACGSTLGNLLRFVRIIDKPFRFDAELVGNTIFLVRKENSPTELIPDVRGFGHTFPENYTTWESDVRGSETHQRMITYDFAGVKCLVRFECDGYRGDLASSSATGNAGGGPSSDAVDLIEALGTTSVSHIMSNTADNLKVSEAGSTVPQKSIFDLKTRSGKWGRSINMEDFLPVLWVKQVPNFIVAYHDGAGLFENIQVQNVEQEISKWESKNKLALRRLAVLLRRIIDIAKSRDNGRIEIYCPSVDGLEIRKQFGEGSTTLPPPLKARWEDAQEAKPTALEDHHRHDSFEDDERFAVASLDDQLYSSDHEDDFTACSAESCGYCGQCSY